MGEVKDRTPWPAHLMHAEPCAWRFGGPCDCSLEAGARSRCEGEIAPAPEPGREATSVLSYLLDRNDADN